MIVPFFTLEEKKYEVTLKDGATYADLKRALLNFDDDYLIKPLFYLNRENKKDSDIIDINLISDDTPLVVVSENLLSEKNFDDIMNTFDYFEYPFSEFYVPHDPFIDLTPNSSVSSNSERKNPFSTRRERSSNELDIDFESLVDTRNIINEEDSIRALKANQILKEKLNQPVITSEKYVPVIAMEPIAPIPALPIERTVPPKRSEWLDLDKEIPFIHSPPSINSKSVLKPSNNLAEIVETDEDVSTFSLERIIDDPAAQSGMRDGLDLSFMAEEDELDDPSYTEGRVRIFRLIRQKNDELKNLQVDNILCDDSSGFFVGYTDEQKQSLRRLFRLGFERNLVKAKFIENNYDEEATKRSLIPFLNST